MAKLGKKELNYLKELSDHAGKLDNAILKGIDIPAGTIVGDIPIQNLDAALELAKYTDDIIDITKVTKYSDNAKKYGDDIFEKTVDNLDDTIIYKLIVSESKFSKAAPWIKNQETLLDNVDKGGFSLRSTRFERDVSLRDLNFIQDSNLNIKGITRTVGDGAGNYSVINF